MFNQKVPHGFCNECGNPLGFFGDVPENIFCYNCSGYKKLDIEESIFYYKNELENIRSDFRNGVIRGNITRYLKNYLEFGEAIVGTEQEEYLTLSSVNINSIAIIDFQIFVISTIGIKWILEDLNYLESITEDYKNEISVLPKKWLIYFRNLIYLDNKLGFILIDKQNNRRFYYFQQLKFYTESLYQFGLINPEDIDKDKFEKIKGNILKKEENIEYVKEFASIHLPLYMICMCYFQFPNMDDRIFSFADIKYTPVIIDYISKIANKYKDSRARNQGEWSKQNPYYVPIDFEKLKQDIPNIGWNDFLYRHIVASNHNPMNYPLLIEYRGKIIITPTRLMLGREMMFESLFHKPISNKLSIVYENEFQNQILKQLRKIGCIIEDPVNQTHWIYISDKKQNTFEFDIIAIFREYILIIECKSFHPTAFFHLKEAVGRREVRVKYFSDQFTKKIKFWIIEKSKSRFRGDFIKIKCRKTNFGEKKSKSFFINLPKDFQNIDESKVIGVFLTQYKEFFKGYLDINQIYYEDLENFLNLLS